MSEDRWHAAFDTWPAFHAFARATSVEEQYRLLKLCPALLTREADLLLLIAQKRATTPREAAWIEKHRLLLRSCRSLGIDEALEKNSASLEASVNRVHLENIRQRGVSEALWGRTRLTSQTATSGVPDEAFSESTPLSHRVLLVYDNLLGPVLVGLMVLRISRGHDLPAVLVLSLLDGAVYWVVGQCLWCIANALLDWYRSICAFGVPRLHDCRRAIHLDRLTELRGADFTMVIVIFAVAAAFVTIWHFSDSTHALYLGVGIAFYGLLARLRWAIPPGILYLASSSIASWETKSRLIAASHGARVVSLLAPGHDWLDVPPHLRSTCYRSANDAQWIELLEELLLLASVVVMDARRSSDALAYEIRVVLEHASTDRPSYLLIQNDLQRQGAIGVAEGHNVTVLTEPELYDAIADLTNRTKI